MKNAGFTLLEVLIAITIVVILGSVVGINLLDAPDKGRVAAAKTQLSVFAQAIAEFKGDTGRLPTPAEGLAALVQATEKAPQGYLEKREVPRDPWGGEYAYLCPGPGGEPYAVVCYGADGEEGGTGYDADLSTAGL